MTPAQQNAICSAIAVLNQRAREIRALADKPQDPSTRAILTASALLDVAAEYDAQVRVLRDLVGLPPDLVAPGSIRQPPGIHGSNTCRECLGTGDENRRGPGLDLIPCTRCGGDGLRV